ncbi:right-handed parallel beta-helix repeat-containing protein [Paenibacillus solisilvae]|uniref:Right-handed parallel beta-helix repeat-containing protein n=1 Tax=Paenibacillus solisilvae TaxID=2486751 RepID=A0ABW0W003_9BACL
MEFIVEKRIALTGKENGNQWNGKSHKMTVPWIVTAIVFSILSAVSYMYIFNRTDQTLHQASNTVNVKTDFNAKGDGLHDDTQAIQAALNDVDKGGTVIIPPGVYKVSKNMANKVSTGYGTSYSAFKITKPATIIMQGAVFQTQTKDQYGVFWIYKTSNVSLKGGSLKGDTLPADGIYTSRVGVLIQECDHCSIDGMYLKNFSQGINIYKSQFSTLRNVTSEFNKGSGIINFLSSNSLIDSCTIRNSGDGHLSLYGGGKNNTVTNCTIIENRTEESGQQGITLEKEKNSTINNNTITGFYYGIDIKNGSDSCTIDNNNAYNNQFNIAIRPGDPGRNGQLTSNNIRIINNTVIKPRNQAGTGGILIKIGSGHLVQGNTIEEGGLLMTGGVSIKSNLEFNNNKFIDNLFVKKSDS